jgi:hypothetical protein
LGGRRRIAETALGLILGFALHLVIVTAAIFFFALARFGGSALNALALVTLSADLGFFFSTLAIFGFALACLDQSVSARIALFIGQRAQNDAGARARRALLTTTFAATRCRRAAARARSRCSGSWLGGGGGHGLRCRRWRRRRGRFSLRRLARSDRAAFHLLDHNGLGPAMGEALTHNALLDRTLQRQRLRGHMQRLVAASILRIAHSALP